MKLLLHSCCAYCAAYTVDFWGRQGWEVTAFWYNPNIHPFREHQLRLEAMLTLAQKRALPLIVDDGYEVIDYFKAIRVVDTVRCRGCFHLRLGRTADRARQAGFSAFTTTLLLSPYQKQKLLRLTGERIAGEKGIPFLHADLRSGYRESHRLGRELHLYHQNYCGCVYSEWERYCPIDRPKKLTASPKPSAKKAVQSPCSEPGEGILPVPGTSPFPEEPALSLSKGRSRWITRLEIPLNPPFPKGGTD